MYDIGVLNVRFQHADIVHSTNKSYVMSENKLICKL